MENSTIKLEWNFKVFRKAPHFLKPLQVLTSVAILITVIIIMWGPLERLWYHALGALLVSGFATLIFALGIQNKLVYRYSCGFLSWNAVEFAYSVVLTYYCGDSTQWAYWLIGYDYDSHPVLTRICLVLFVILTLLYAASVVYIAIVEIKTLLSRPVTTVTKPDEQKVFLED